MNIQNLKESAVSYALANGLLHGEIIGEKQYYTHMPISLFPFVVLCAIVMQIFYKKDPESEKFKYVGVITNLITSVLYMFLADVGNGYVVGIAISCLYILYFDANLIKILCVTVAISTTIFTGLDVWYNYPNVDSNDALNDVLVTIAFAVGFSIMTKIAKKNNDNNINEIKEATKKAVELNENILNAV